MESNYIPGVYRCRPISELFLLFALKHHKETVQLSFEMSGFSLTLKAEKVDVLCVGPSVFLSFELSLIRSLSRFIINVNVNGKGFFTLEPKPILVG